MRKLLALLVALTAALSIGAGVALAGGGHVAPAPTDPSRCDVLTDDASIGIGVCDLVHVEDLLGGTDVDVDPTVGPPIVNVGG